MNKALIIALLLTAVNSAQAEPKASGDAPKANDGAITRHEADMLADELDYQRRGSQHITVDVIIHRCGPGMSKVYC